MGLEQTVEVTRIAELAGVFSRKYPAHRGCVKSSLSSCSGTGPRRLLYDVGVAAFDFVCYGGGKRGEAVINTHVHTRMYVCVCTRTHTHTHTH